MLPCGSFHGYARHFFVNLRIKQNAAKFEATAPAVEIRTSIPKTIATCNTSHERKIRGEYRNKLLSMFFMRFFLWQVFAFTNQFIGNRTLWRGNSKFRKPPRIARNNPLQSPRMGQRCALHSYCRVRWESAPSLKASLSVTEYAFSRRTRQ